MFIQNIVELGGHGPKIHPGAVFGVRTSHQHYGARTGTRACGDDP